MSESFAPRAKPLRFITNPVNGDILTVHDLPDRFAHWTPGRKALVMDAVNAELLSLEEAAERWRVTLEEFGAMRARYTGRSASLRSTRMTTPLATQDDGVYGPPHPVCAVGKYVLNDNAGTFAIGDKQMHVTRTERRVLRILMERVGHIVARDVLMHLLYDHVGKPRPQVKILDVLICKVRRRIMRLDDSMPVPINTIWGRGYEFVTS